MYLAGLLAVAIFFLLTLSRCLERVAPRNRAMQPGEVWLNLIPCFSYIWLFFTVSRVADSLDDEFYDRRLRGDGDFGRSIGTAFATLRVCSFIPYIGSLFAIAALVCLIVYWVKLAGYSRQLLEDDLGESDRYDDDD